MAASESIVSNTLKYLVFRKNNVTKNRKFLRGNLKAKTKLKNMKSQEC